MAFGVIDYLFLGGMALAYVRQATDRCAKVESVREYTT